MWVAESQIQQQYLCSFCNTMPLLYMCTSYIATNKDQVLNSYVYRKAKLSSYITFISILWLVALD